MSVAASLIGTMSICMSLGASPVVNPKDAVAQGQTKQALQKAYDRLCAPPLNDFDFVMSDVSFKLKRRFNEFSGDVSGRMVGALSADGPALGQDSAMISQIVAALPQHQKADGHFGVDQDLKAGLKPEREMPILWGNSRLLLALAEHAERTNDAAALKLARSIGDYVVNTREYFGKPENLKLGGSYSAGYTTCYPALIEGMAKLANVTKDSRYLEEARYIAHIALQDTSFEKHHSHGRLAAYRGMLEIDHVAGTAEFVKAVQAGCQKIENDLIMPTGGVTEVFDRTDNRDEGCSEVDWIMANVLLWRATGDTHYLDVADFAIRNHLLAMQFPNGGFGHHYFQTLKHGDKSYQAGGVGNWGAEAYWCCSKHGAQCLGDLTRWGVVSDGENVMVTGLAEVRATLPCKSGLATVSAVQTGLGTWKVTISTRRAADIPVRFRAPAWAKVLKVNGKDVEVREGWASFNCPVKEPKEVTVEWPTGIRLLGPYGDKASSGEPNRLAAGAEMFCLPDAFLPEGFLANDEIPTILLATDDASADAIPVAVRGSKGMVRTRLIPISARPMGGCRHLFNVKKVSENEVAGAREYVASGEPVYVLFACDGHAELFLNGKSIGTREGWGESARFEVSAKKGKNTLVVKMQSKSARPGLIGFVQTAKDRLVTSAAEWELAECPANSSAGAGWENVAWGSHKLQDLGGFGAAPWLHMPAEFAGTEARWIWPDASPKAGDVWLVRYSFDID